MQHKDSHNPADKSRLISVIALLLVIFAIWFGVLLKDAQHDLNSNLEKRVNTVIIRKPHNSGAEMNNMGSVDARPLSGAK